MIGITDLDGNGKPDLLWQEEFAHKVAVWCMTGTQGNQFQSFVWLESNGIPGCEPSPPARSVPRPHEVLDRPAWSLRKT